MNEEKIKEIVLKEDLFKPVYIPGIDREAASEVIPSLGFHYLEERLDRKENILYCKVKDVEIGDGTEGNSVLIFMSNIEHIKEGGRRVTITINKADTEDFDPASDKLQKVATMIININKTDKKDIVSCIFSLFGGDYYTVAIPDFLNEDEKEEEENADAEPAEENGGIVSE